MLYLTIKQKKSNFFIAHVRMRKRWKLQMNEFFIVQNEIIDEKDDKNVPLCFTTDGKKTEKVYLENF